MTKMKREKTKINKIRNGKGELTNTKEMQGIIRDYFENLHSNELESLKEMGKFLGTYDYLNLNQKDINHLNRSITHSEIKAAIVSQKRKLQTNHFYEHRCKNPQ
jgi:hypothetical protein